MATALKVIEPVLVEVDRNYLLDFRKVSGMSFPYDVVIHVAQDGYILGRFEIKALVEESPGDYAAFLLTFCEDASGQTGSLILVSPGLLVDSDYKSVRDELRQIGKVVRAEISALPLAITARKLGAEIETAEFIFSSRRSDLIFESFRLSVTFQMKS